MLRPPCLDDRQPRKTSAGFAISSFLLEPFQTSNSAKLPHLKIPDRSARLRESWTPPTVELLGVQSVSKPCHSGRESHGRYDSFLVFAEYIYFSSSMSHLLLGDIKSSRLFLSLSTLTTFTLLPPLRFWMMFQNSSLQHHAGDLRSLASPNPLLCTWGLELSWR